MGTKGPNKVLPTPLVATPWHVSGGERLAVGTCVCSPEDAQVPLSHTPAEPWGKVVGGQTPAGGEHPALLAAPAGRREMLGDAQRCSGSGAEPLGAGIPRQEGG